MSSSSVSKLGLRLGLESGGEEGGRGGSHEAMRRWDLARATAVRLVRMEAAVSGARAEGGAGVIGVGGRCVFGGFVLAGMFWLYD